MVASIAKKQSVIQSRCWGWLGAVGAVAPTLRSALASPSARMLGVSVTTDTDALGGALSTLDCRWMVIMLRTTSNSAPMTVKKARRRRAALCMLRAFLRVADSTM